MGSRARGGPQEAQKRLADFWRAASVGGSLPALQRAVIERLFAFLPLDESPMQMWLSALSRYFSPYTLNPLNINPLKTSHRAVCRFRSGPRLQ